MPKAFDPWLHDPQRTMLLTHADGLQLSPSLSSAYRNQREHDPIDIDRAREIASLDDPIPVGILYRNPDAPCYEDLRHAGQMRSPEYIRAGLNRELDKYTVWPETKHRADASARPDEVKRVMDMQAKHQDQLIFHLTGKRQGDGLSRDRRPRPAPGAARALPRPGRAAPRLPGRAGDSAAAPECVRSLSSLVDAVLKDVAPRGIEGERLRRHALQLEREIRRAVDAGASGTLAELWEAAAARLGAREGETLEQVLSHAGGALRADGEVLGCTHDMPARLITHAWQAAQRDKARRFHADLSRLVLKLSDILRAAFSHSQAGRKPQSLKQSLGGPHQAAFDFDALVAHRRQGRAARRTARRAARARRAHAGRAGVAALLRAARRCGRCRGAGLFRLRSSTTARPRRRPSASACPRWSALVKAISIAELEATGRYVEAEHDLVFEAFGEHSLTADDLARFPDYLVCIPPRAQRRAGERQPDGDAVESGCR